ncbi:hypothetical protein [Calothrix sp. 336/3]|nr:hypothetical protein [Calothrix sp. 336/3]
MGVTFSYKGYGDNILWKAAPRLQELHLHKNQIVEYCCVAAASNG